MMNELLSVADAAAWSGLTEAGVRLAIRRGDLVARKVGVQWIVKRGDLLDWLESRLRHGRPRRTTE